MFLNILEICLILIISRMGKYPKIYVIISMGKPFMMISNDELVIIMFINEIFFSIFLIHDIIVFIFIKIKYN